MAEGASLGRRDEMLTTLVSLVPFRATEAFRVIHLSSGEASVVRAIAERFPLATVLALDEAADHSIVLRDVEPFRDRVTMQSCRLGGLDWWDSMVGADVVIAPLAVHVLNDAKKRYVYKAVAERLSSQGVFLIADRIAPALLHHLIWLKHAGFSQVDCFWLFEGHAVFGGFKQREASTARLPAGS